ncbi:hypothetical protein ACFE04_011355 [Oxalis oulophora]
MWKLRSSDLVLVLCSLIAIVSCQGSNSSSSKWLTLSGDPPHVIARGGFSGLFPDSSSTGYKLAVLTSVETVVMWCDVQLTKDGSGICFPDLILDNATSDIGNVFRNTTVYPVNGVPTTGHFALDYTLNDLKNVVLVQSVASRPIQFDGNLFPILTVQEMNKEVAPPRLWLNVQHDAFYKQHNLSMRNFLVSASKTVIIDYISSPEISFLTSIASQFKSSKLVLRFLQTADVEPSTNQTYGSLLKNLTFVSTFASGILVPKTYIWPVDESSYLLPHTSLVSDAHKVGLEVFAADFASDVQLSYNYSYDPITEYLYYINNGEFSVDGVLSDFPISPSEAVDCFAHLGRNATAQVNMLVISKCGASGDYPGCTDLAYTKAIQDGVDVLDCPVQMSSDGIPFCMSSANLIDSTNVAQTGFTNVSKKTPLGSGIYSFSLTWSQIQTLTPSISNPYSKYFLYRNPKFKNAGHFMTLSDFLDMTKNITSLTGISVGIENTVYLAQQGLDVKKAVQDALTKAGYDNQTSLKILIQSSDSSLLKEFKDKNKYELVYWVDESIRDATNSTITEIKTFADSVVIGKESVFPDSLLFLTGSTNVVPKLQAFNVPVYVETFDNEFVSQAWDFFSDATVEINSYYEGAGISGVITAFPKTSARYKVNRCLNRKTTPAYMTPVQPGSLLQLVTTQDLPPAQAPNPVLTEADVTEPPIPPISALSQTSTPAGATAPSPPNGASTTATSVFLSSLAVLFAAVLL